MLINKRIIFGHLSFGISMAALLITIAEIIILFSLPAATYIFKMAAKINFIPLGLAIIGLLFYFLQWRKFTTNLINIGFVVNALVLLVDLYLYFNINAVI